MSYLPVSPVTDLLALLLRALVWLIAAHVVLNWVIVLGVRLPGRYALLRAVDRVVGPALAPLRRALPPERFGGWDLSPYVAIVLLNWVGGLLFGR